jgi:hypothetical protein
MCAYNVRQKKSLDNDPAAGHARKVNLFREAGTWAVGLAAMYLVYRLVRHFLL